MDTIIEHQLTTSEDIEALFDEYKRLNRWVSGPIQRAPDLVFIPSPPPPNSHLLSERGGNWAGTAKPEKSCAKSSETSRKK